MERVKPVKQIQIDRHDRIWFYGNVAGYVNGEAAVVDPLFQKDELIRYLEKHRLTPAWSDGVYDRLAHGGSAGDHVAHKRCRIWQLRPDVEVGMKFISYTEMLSKYGEPRIEDYAPVFDDVVDTDDPEQMLEHFSQHPFGSGHALSLSDIIELYDGKGSEYLYVDLRGFQKLDFSTSEQSHNMAMSL